MIGKLLKWFWKGNADENIEQKEYESMSGLVEEFGEEQEQEEIDTVFDNLEGNQEQTGEVKTVAEDVLEEFKVSDSENCRIFESKLIIDGASYSDMGDYSWFFTLANENFPALYTALTGQTELPDDVTDGLKQILDTVNGALQSLTKMFDEKTGYHSQSFLTVPLKNHEDEIIGVLQLLNAQNNNTKKNIKSCNIIY